VSQAIALTVLNLVGKDEKDIVVHTLDKDYNKEGMVVDNAEVDSSNEEAVESGGSASHP